MISTWTNEDVIIDSTLTTDRRSTVVHGEHASHTNGSGHEEKPTPPLVNTVPDLSSTQLWCVPGKKNNAGIFADSFWWKVRYDTWKGSEKNIMRAVVSARWVTAFYPPEFIRQVTGARGKWFAFPHEVDTVALPPKRAEAYSNHESLFSSADIASATSTGNAATESTAVPSHLSNNLVDTDSPSDTAPEVDPSTFLTEGGGVTEEGVRWEGKNKQEKVRGREEIETRKRKKQAKKGDRLSGAIMAPSRTGEGYVLPSSGQKTCKPDALYNGLRTLGFEGVSLNRLRSLSIPKLGLDPMASWKTISDALSTLEIPFMIEEVTSRFKVKGGPLFNLLHASPGVYLVSLLVILHGTRNRHCVMLSTIRERKAPFGKLLDNHAKTKPLYLEKKDRNCKARAKRAWRHFIGQNPALCGSTFAIEPAEVYGLRHTVRHPQSLQ